MNTHEAIEESESELLYDWRFTVNQFVLATSLLRNTTIVFFFFLLQLNPCGNSTCVTILSDDRMGLFLLRICLAFDKCKYRTCSMVLKVLPSTDNRRTAELGILYVASIYSLMREGVYQAVA
jgi:hypothetical protein